MNVSVVIVLMVMVLTLDYRRVAGDKYVGETKDNLMHGQGTYYSMPMGTSMWVI